MSDNHGHSHGGEDAYHPPSLSSGIVPSVIGVVVLISFIAIGVSFFNKDKKPKNENVDVNTSANEKSLIFSKTPIVFSTTQSYLEFTLAPNQERIIDKQGFKYNFYCTKPVEFTVLSIKKTILTVTTQQTSVDEYKFPNPHKYIVCKNTNTDSVTIKFFDIK